MQSLDHMIDLALAELEDEVTQRSDPIMALADCIGVVLLHWDVLDSAGRRELLARVNATIRLLESEARLVSL